jgi:hypothetical protein
MAAAKQSSIGVAYRVIAASLVAQPLLYLMGVAEPQIPALTAATSSGGAAAPDISTPVLAVCR